LYLGFAVGLGRAAQERWGGRLFVSSILVAIVAGFFRVEVFVGIVVAMFVSAGGWAHLFLLVPRFRRRPTEPPALSGDKTDE
jgi:hypothetical protein